MYKETLIKLVKEELLQSSYELLTEQVDPSKHYDFEHSRKNLWKFTDRNKLHHFITVHVSLYKEDKACEVKFGWIDSNNTLRYDKPPTYDERIFNTHIYIFINEIIKYYSEYFDKFYLEALDPLRHRLYRQTLNKFLDKTKYNMEEKPNNTLVISPITS